MLTGNCLHLRLSNRPFYSFRPVIWHLNGNEAGVDVVLIPISPLLLSKSSCGYPDVNEKLIEIGEEAWIEKKIVQSIRNDMEKSRKKKGYQQLS